MKKLLSFILTALFITALINTFRIWRRKPFKTALCRAYSDGLIDSSQLHALAGRFDRVENPDHPKNREGKKRAVFARWATAGATWLILFLLIITSTGCAHLASRTSKTTIDANGKPEVVTTHTYITTFFDSQSEVTKLKTSVADKTSGTTIGSVNQESSGTNANALVSSVVEGAIAGAMKFAK